MGHGTGAACVHFLMTSEALPEGKTSLDLPIFQMQIIICFDQRSNLIQYFD